MVIAYGLGFRVYLSYSLLVPSIVTYSGFRVYALGFRA